MPATEKYWRPLGTMHKVFAGSALLLLLATLVMTAWDQNREWKKYQRQSEELRNEQLEAERATIQSGSYQKNLQSLQDSIRQAEAGLAEKEAATAPLEANLRELTGQIELLERQVKFKNAEVGVLRADRDIEVRDNVDPAKQARTQQRYEAEEAEARSMTARLDALKARRDTVKGELAVLREAVTEARAALVKHQEDERLISDQIERLRPTGKLAAFKRRMKQWPIIEAFNPEIRIIQDWIPDLKQTLGMAKVARFDRCRSCHTQIDQFAAGNIPTFPKADGKGNGYANPFCSHPRPDVYITDVSPHPLNKFGCTSCHEGDGSGTSFQAAEHTPSDPIVAAKWKKEYGWHSNHFWEYPQHSKAFIESSCLRCHHNVTELGVNSEFGPTAPKLFDGYSLIRDYGCFGCHEINGYDGSRPIGPDMRLEPQTLAEAERIAADPNQVAGTMRKVGPSLRHVASKTTGDFISYWTEDPQRFRPDTRMPRFFHLSNQEDHLAELLQPVELAGIAAYLIDRSETLKVDAPQEGYEPSAERGRVQFSRRGCLACHSHDDPEFAGIRQDFGPNLTNVGDKLLPGADGYNWLYTWIRDPHRHHPRSRMPYMFLTPEGEGDAYTDPAADIAAFLLERETRPIPSLAMPGSYTGLAGLKAGDSGVVIGEVLPGSPATRATVPGQDMGTPANPPLLAGDVVLSWNGVAITSAEQFASFEQATAPGTSVTLVRSRAGQEMELSLVATLPLEDLARLFLSKQMTADEANATLAGGALVRRKGTVQADGTVDFEFVPVPAEQIKGDEIELLHRADDPAQLSAEERQRRLLLYVGRRTVSRYGCYGCHDIAGFEEARPIGTALQDWGRKDTSKLAPEHIEEYLHHHGEPDGSSTYDAVAEIVAPANAGSVSHTQRMKATFYDSLMHHGRAGFLWQKLREPRSYDYEKTATKGWDERLKMPKFPFSGDQIESIATFVLGLVADPPPPQYLYQPQGAALARVEGEKLLERYNCTSCHMVEMPGIRFETDLRSIVGMTRTELVDWFALHAEGIASGEITQAGIRDGDGSVEPAEYQEALATFVGNAEQLLNQRLAGVDDMATGFVPHLAAVALAGGATTGQRASAVNAFLDEYPELLLADPIDPSDLPETVPMALRLKPPVRRSAPITSSAGQGTIEIHGLVFAAPDPTETDPDFREYAFELWENAEIGGRYKLSGVNSRYVIPEKSVHQLVDGRGGTFNEWLAPRLRETLTGGDGDKARQAAVPPLYKEGIKVQTPWLYRFLKDPDQLRFTTVLRMPRFNMSDSEAQTLANYFAAVDGAPFPYQRIPQQEQPYLALRDAEFQRLEPESEETYLDESWKALSVPVCNGCHAVGGRPYRGADPTKDVHAPNLDRVQQRLRPDYLRLWLAKPKAFLPYTSMPNNFPRNQNSFPDLFGGNHLMQVEGVADALLNYYNLMEAHGRMPDPLPVSAAPAAEPAATEPEAAPEAGGDAAATSN